MNRYGIVFRGSVIANLKLYQILDELEIDITLHEFETVIISPFST